MLADREQNWSLLLVASTKLEKVRAIHMTMKEKLRIHKQIVESNKRKLKDWKEGRKTA